jgi:methyl-accepting chemotaxis protein
MNEMAVGTEQINKAVNHVNDISRKNEESIRTLSSEISKFKVDDEELL